MAQFMSGSMSNAEASYKFDECFGKAGINEEECYYDPLAKHSGATINKFHDMNKAHQANLRKAPSFSNVSGGTVTVYGLMPSWIDPEIVDRTARETPLVALLPRRAVRGRSHVYNVITAKAGAQFLPDDAALADQVDTYAATSTQMKYLYAVGRVTGPALASGAGFSNLLAEDVRVKMASMNEALENEIINGNTSTNANGFQGLRQSISTNSTSNSSAAITLAQIDADLATVFEANGNVDLVVTDATTLNVIKGLLMDFQRNIEQPSDRLEFGIPGSFVYHGALFIRDRYMPTAATSREMLYLDLRYVYLAVLQEMSFMELAQVNDSNKFALKWYGALIVTAESLMAERTNIA